MNESVDFNKTKTSFKILEDYNDFDKKLKGFLEENSLKLDVPERTEKVEALKESLNKETLGNYVIANDFKLSTEGADIKLAYKNDDDQLLVVKEMSKEEMKKLSELHQWGSLTVENYLKKEGFNNPNVLLPVETIENNEKVYRFYEAMDIDLEKYLEKHTTINSKDSILLIIKICSGVKDLHSVGIANIDLAPLNIMLKKNNLKIIDLDGASIDTNKDGIFSRNYLGGNRFTSAPELFNERPIFDKTVDIYAVSANLYRLICGDWPYNTEAQTRDLGMSYEEKMETFKKEHESGNIIFPESISHGLKEIIKKGMDPIPENRYQSMEELILNLINLYNSEKQLSSD